MGYQDRDYYREDSADSGFQLRSWTVRLIIIHCVIFLANALTSSNDQNVLTSTLALQPEAIAHPTWWWQFLTYGLVHSPKSPWHIAGNMIGLWVFGRPIEQRFGGMEMLRIYFLAIVLGGVTWSARQYFLGTPVIINGVQHWPGLCWGASGGVTALIVLFCLLNPRQTLLLFFALPIPAWMFGILVVASDLTGGYVPGMERWNIAFDVHLAGAAFAAGYWSLGVHFGRLPGMREISFGLGKLAALFQSRPQMRVHHDEEPDDWEDNLEAEADRLLAKIAQQGESSLTARERRVLENYSRRMRDKRR